MVTTYRTDSTKPSTHAMPCFPRIVSMKRRVSMAIEATRTTKMSSVVSKTVGVKISCMICLYATGASSSLAESSAGRYSSFVYSLTMRVMENCGEMVRMHSLIRWIQSPGKPSAERLV